jgi:transposase
MGKIVREHSSEFKEAAVRLAKAGDKSVKQVAHELGIGRGLIYEWMQKQEVDGLPNADKPASVFAELKRLKREHARVVMERDILKKAIAVFSRHSKKDSGS